MDLLASACRLLTQQWLKSTTATLTTMVEFQAVTSHLLLRGAPSTTTGRESSTQQEAFVSTSQILLSMAMRPLDALGVGHGNMKMDTLLLRSVVQTLPTM